MESHEGIYMRRVRDLLNEYDATQPRDSDQNLPPNRVTPPHNLQPSHIAPPRNFQPFHATPPQNQQPHHSTQPPNLQPYHGMIQNLQPNHATSQNFQPHHATPSPSNLMGMHTPPRIPLTLKQRIANVTGNKFAPYNLDDTHSKSQFRAKARTPSRRPVSVEFKIPKVILLPVRAHYLSLNKRQNSHIAAYKLFRDNFTLLRTDSESEVKRKLRQRFDPMLNDKDFTMLKMEGDVLVEPILDVGQVLDGNNVVEIFLRQQKKMFLIPSVDLEVEFRGLDCPFYTDPPEECSSLNEMSESEDTLPPCSFKNDRRSQPILDYADHNYCAKPPDHDLKTDEFKETLEEKEDNDDDQVAAAIQESLQYSKAGIMETLRSQLTNGIQSKLIADRGHAFESALIWFQLPDFDYKKDIYVQFTNTFGRKGEGIEPHMEAGVDSGGLTFEFFQLSIDEACLSSLFEGPEDARFLTLDTDAVCEDRFFHCGLLFALSITRGGPGPNCFSPEFVTCLGKQSLSDRHLSEDAVFDVDLRTEIETLKNINSIDVLKDFVLNNSIVGLAGINTVINTLDEKDRVTEACLKFILVHRLEAAFNQFIKGLQTFSFLSTMSRNMPLLREYFEPRRTPLTADVVFKTFTIVRSKEGTKESEIEDQVIMYFQNYLRIIEASDRQRLDPVFREANKETLCETPTLASILSFTTGLKREPPFGWKLEPQLTFQHTINNEFTVDLKEGQKIPLHLLPKANVCGATLQLPVMNKTFNTFKRFMNKGLMWGTSIELT